MTTDSYTITLTFDEWMDIVHALGHVTAQYRAKDMQEVVEQRQEIERQIASQIQASTRQKHE